MSDLKRKAGVFKSQIKDNSPAKRSRADTNVTGITKDNSSHDEEFKSDMLNGLAQTTQILMKKH